MRQLKISNQITARESASLGQYLKEIGYEKLITVEEETALARRVRKGDSKAVEELIRANLRFVVTVAKQFQNRGLSLNDLINEGNIGLIKATERFDETRGFRLISYAVWWIRSTIMHAIDEQSRLVRLPANKAVTARKIRHTVTRMEQQLHRDPSMEEVSNEINMSSQAVYELMGASTRQVSIDSPLPGSEQLTLMDVIPDKDGENAEQREYNRSLKKELKHVISTLPAKEGEILRLHFGLNGQEPMTLEEIGVKYDALGSQIRLVKDKALARLRHSHRSKALKEFLG